MCSGSTTHIINGKERVELRTGNILLLNRHTSHAIETTGQEDIAVNFVMRQGLFDLAMELLDREDPLSDFVSSSLRSREERGFLLFNVYPASVFMGDTGSLALGGFVVSVSYALHMPLFIPLVGLVYFLEVVSVIVQVAYFKLTGGRRLLKMAPLHHHFELCGWSEAKITAVFSILTAMVSLLALLGL